MIMVTWVYFHQNLLTQALEFSLYFHYFNWFKTILKSKSHLLINIENVPQQVFVCSCRLMVLKCHLLPIFFLRIRHEMSFFCALIFFSLDSKLINLHLRLLLERCKPQKSQTCFCCQLFTLKSGKDVPLQPFFFLSFFENAHQGILITIPGWFFTKNKKWT